MTKLHWPGESSSIMRGIFGNLIDEAQRLTDIFQGILACDTCRKWFDATDTRAEIFDSSSHCPACVIEHDAHKASEALTKAKAWEAKCDKAI